MADEVAGSVVKDSVKLGPGLAWEVMKETIMAGTCEAAGGLGGRLQQRKLGAHALRQGELGVCEEPNKAFL